MVKIMSVNSATTAAHERSFSMARRIKTWLPSSMTQRKFNALAILNPSKSLVDKLPLVKVTSDFAGSLANHLCHGRNDFEVFIEEDLK